jgi:hypothetical protein
MKNELVGGLEHFLFFHILGIILPTDALIFFRGVETTNQVLYIEYIVMLFKNQKTSGEVE